MPGPVYACIAVSGADRCGQGIAVCTGEACGIAYICIVTHISPGARAVSAILILQVICSSIAEGSGVNLEAHSEPLALVDGCKGSVCGRGIGAVIYAGADVSAVIVLEAVRYLVKGCGRLAGKRYKVVFKRIMLGRNPGIAP